MHKALSKIDWKYSIDLDYEMDINILNLVRNKDQIIDDFFYEDGSNNLKEMFKYLVPCLKKVVIPMS